MDTTSWPAPPVTMHQTAPYPAELAGLVEQMSYRPGWTFRLRDYDRGQSSIGLTLIITALVADAYNPDHMIPIVHLMPVPPAAYMATSWRRWLLERCLLVERHEACEMFMIGDDRPFAPNHGPGEDPYRITELTSDEARRTSFRGIVDDARAPAGFRPVLDPHADEVDGPAVNLQPGPPLTGADLM